MSSLENFFNIFWDKIGDRDKESVSNVFGKEYSRYFESEPFSIAPRKEYNNLF